MTDTIQIFRALTGPPIKREDIRYLGITEEQLNKSGFTLLNEHHGSLHGLGLSLIPRFLGVTQGLPVFLLQKMAKIFIGEKVFFEDGKPAIAQISLPIDEVTSPNSRIKLITMEFRENQVLTREILEKISSGMMEISAECALTGDWPLIKKYIPSFWRPNQMIDGKVIHSEGWSIGGLGEGNFGRKR